MCGYGAHPCISHAAVFGARRPRARPGNRVRAAGMARAWIMASPCPSSLPKHSSNGQSGLSGGVHHGQRILPSTVCQRHCPWHHASRTRALECVAQPAWSSARGPAAQHLKRQSEAAEKRCSEQHHTCHATVDGSSWVRRNSAVRRGEAVPVATRLVACSSRARPEVSHTPLASDIVARTPAREELDSCLSWFVTNFKTTSHRATSLLSHCPPPRPHNRVNSLTLTTRRRDL